MNGRDDVAAFVKAGSGIEDGEAFRRDIDRAARRAATARAGASIFGSGSARAVTEAARIRALACSGALTRGRDRNVPDGLCVRDRRFWPRRAHPFDGFDRRGVAFGVRSCDDELVRRSRSRRRPRRRRCLVLDARDRHVLDRLAEVGRSWRKRG